MGRRPDPKPRKVTIIRYESPDGKRCKASDPGARKVRTESDTYYVTLHASVLLTEILLVLRRIQESLAREQGLEGGQRVAPFAAASALVEQLVTLDQCAAMVQHKKRSLERYRDRMPEPAIAARPGRASLWRWSEMRPWLEKEFGRTLPERFPGVAG